MARRPVWSQHLRGDRQHRPVCWNHHSIGHIAPLNGRAAGARLHRAPGATRQSQRRWPCRPPPGPTRPTRVVPADRLPDAGIFSAPYEKARTAGMTRTGWSVVALLAALCIGGLIWLGRQTPAEEARVDIIEPLSTVGTTGALRGTFVRTLPGNATITIPAVGSAEDRLSLYLASASPGEDPPSHSTASRSTRIRPCSRRSPVCSSTTSRRFSARPASVVLSAIDLWLPYPSA